MKKVSLERIEAPLSKSAQAYTQIKAAILYAEFRPGDLISIRTLAAMLGTSTMPVREAVTRLVTERALELLPNRGIRVPFLTSIQARDLLLARLPLEGIATEIAASEITSSELRQLEHHESDLESALRKRDFAKAVRFNIQFHLQIYRASRSETLVALIETLYLRYAPTLYIVMDLIPGGRAAKAKYVHEHHASIIDALRAGDAAAARAALEHDVGAASALDGFLTSSNALESALNERNGTMIAGQAALQAPSRKTRRSHATARLRRGKPPRRDD